MIAQRRGPHSSSGFTLVEVLLTLLIMAGIMVTITQVLTGVRKTRDEIHNIQERQLSGPAILSRLERDLRAMFVFDRAARAWRELESFRAMEPTEEWRGYADRLAHVQTIQVDPHADRRLYAGVEVGGAYASTIGDGRLQDWSSGFFVAPTWESSDNIGFFMNAAETVVQPPTAKPMGSVKITMVGTVVWSAPKSTPKSLGSWW